MKNALILAVLAAVGYTAPEFCWKGTHTRGAGHPITTCHGGLEKSGLICYDKCNDGYSGVGPVCWRRCDDGYHDDGAFCRKDAHIYGKGCCCTIWGCCHNCNSGYTDDGCTCRKNAHIYAKHSYGRGVGKPMGCADGLELSGALCYPSCNPGFHGVGPVCWSSCPKGWSDCGAGCAPDGHTCGDKIIKMVTEMGSAIANTVSMVIGDDNKSKTAQKIKKIADKIKANAPLAAKVANYANKIFNKAKENGEPITEEEAQQRAEETVAQFADENVEGDQWDKIMDKVAEHDPTGLMAAGKVFKHPLCHQIQQ